MAQVAQPDHRTHQGGTLLYGSRPANIQEVRFWEVSRSDSLSIFRFTTASPAGPNERLYLPLLPFQVRAPLAAKASGQATWEDNRSPLATIPATEPGSAGPTASFWVASSFLSHDWPGMAPTRKVGPTDNDRDYHTEYGISVGAQVLVFLKPLRAAPEYGFCLPAVVHRLDRPSRKTRTRITNYRASPGEGGRRPQTECTIEFDTIDLAIAAPIARMVPRRFDMISEGDLASQRQYIATLERWVMSATHPFGHGSLKAF